MRWHQGREQVDRLIADGGLQRVPANREHADQLLGQAHRDLESAELLLDANPKRAYESIYDAARMALTAVLENEGLRPTSRPFDRMRRTRNRSEYPSFTTPDVTPDNVRADLPVAASIVEICEGVLDQMSPF